MMERRNVAGTRLGALEAEVLDQLWAAGEPLGARELAARLSGPRRADSTVVTVLTHLVAKGLVQRAGDGRRFLYSAADPAQLTARAIEQLLAAAADRRAVLAHLIEGTQDPGLLEELAALLRDNQP